jgi:dimethylamine monooxygenase subunit A
MMIDWLTPASRMPWPVTAPFRMRPNLEKLDSTSPALLLRDELISVYARERTKIIESHAERAIVGTADERALSAIQELVGERTEPAAFRDEHVITENHSRQAAATAQEIALQLQEDFVILKNDDGILRTEYLSVCFPSRWDPREKLGLDFAAIHAPVADNQMLQAAGSSIMAMAFMRQSMLRHVWLIVPSANLAQHPEQSDYSWTRTLGDSAPLLTRLFFRVERQTTWPLPHLGRAVFFIRVLMCPLVDVLRAEPLRAAQLSETLASMTPAVVAYRGMTDAIPRLLSELKEYL